MRNFRGWWQPVAFVAVAAAVLGYKAMGSVPAPVTESPVAKKDAEDAAAGEARARAAEAERVAECKVQLEANLTAGREGLRRGDTGKVFDLLAPCYLVSGNAELDAMYLRAQAAVQRRVAAAERAEMKKQGVSIGMTAERALLSNWGRPERVNRTTTASGTREQWVYPGHSYLYFDDGVLTAIQN